MESAVFTVWDVGGPASMAIVNQCCFTDKALYVVVWNLALGEEAVASLQFWLLSIEVRGPAPPAPLPAQQPRFLGWFGVLLCSAELEPMPPAGA